MLFWQPVFGRLLAWQKQHNNEQQRSILHLIFDHLIGFFLSVVLSLEKRDYPENLHVVFCHNK